MKTKFFTVALILLLIVQVIPYVQAQTIDRFKYDNDLDRAMCVMSYMHENFIKSLIKLDPQLASWVATGTGTSLSCIGMYYSDWKATQFSEVAFKSKSVLLRNFSETTILKVDYAFAYIIAKAKTGDLDYFIKLIDAKNLTGKETEIRRLLSIFENIPELQSAAKIYEENLYKTQAIFKNAPPGTISERWIVAKPEFQKAMLSAEVLENWLVNPENIPTLEKALRDTFGQPKLIIIRYNTNEFTRLETLAEEA